MRQSPRYPHLENAITRPRNPDFTSLKAFLRVRDLKVQRASTGFETRWIVAWGTRFLAHFWAKVGSPQLKPKESTHQISIEIDKILDVDWNFSISAKGLWSIVLVSAALLNFEKPRKFTHFPKNCVNFHYFVNSVFGGTDIPSIKIHCPANFKAPQIFVCFSGKLFS